MSKMLLLLITLLPGLVHAEFQLSELSPKRETKRRKAFTEWVNEKTLKEEYERYDRKGQFPIYHESSAKGERRLYEDNPDGFMYQIWSLYGEKGFIKKSQALRKDNYVLLTASKFTTDKGHTLYRGIWVSKDIEERMVRVIERYGISQAVISADHIPSK